MASKPDPILVLGFERSGTKIVKAIYSIIGYIPDNDYIKKVITTKDPWVYKGRKMCGLRCKGLIE